jgi:hypothetical protein
MQITTQDLYCGAYLLSNGDRLDGTKLIRGRGNRPLVSFIFSGPEIEEHSRKYQNGQATVNVASFKIAIEHLKDIIFEQTRVH